MTETELWRRMGAHLPPGRLEAWADSVVMSGLGGRTVDEAIAAGMSFRDIWRVVAEKLEVPEHGS